MATPDTQEEASSSTPAFRIGEAVLVRRYGNAVVVSGLVTEPGHKFFGRYLVRYPDGREYHALPSSLRKFEQPPARVLVTETTDHYRAAAQAFCHPGHIVLEVGSSYGTTCELIHLRGAQVVGIDKGHELVAQSRIRYPHLRFEVLDAFDVAALTALSTTGKFDVILIDIGGIAELHTVMCLLGTYFRAFKRSLLIVKNKYLKTLMGNMQVYVPPLEQQQQQPKQPQQQQQSKLVQQQQQQSKQPKQQPQLGDGSGGGSSAVHAEVEAAATVLQHSTLNETT